MPEERNYHIFYRLLAGLTDKDKSSLHLTVAKDYHYLSQGNCFVCEGMDDKEAFANIRRAMKVKWLVFFLMTIKILNRREISSLIKLALNC